MKGLIFFFIIAINSSFSAQTQYEKAVNHLNYKLVELSIKEGGSKYLEEFHKQFKIDKINSETIQSFFKNKQDISETMKLSLVIESLKKDDVSKSDLDKIKSFLKNSIYENTSKYKYIYTFENKRKNDANFMKFMVTLNDDIDKILSESPETSITKNIPKDDDKDITYYKQELEKIKKELLLLHNSNYDNKSWYLLLSEFPWNVTLIIILIWLFSMWFYYKDKISFISKNKTPNGSNNFSLNGKLIDNIIYQLLERRRFSDYVDKHINDNFDNLFNNHSVKILQDCEIICKKCINEYDSQHPVLKDNFGTIVSEPKRIEIETNHNRKRLDNSIFFMPNPNPEGSFNNSSAKPNFIEGASIYRFEIITENVAEFFIDTREAAINLAIQSVQSNIDPVCEAENHYNPKSKNIETRKPGLAKLNNDKWEVKKENKAIIKYL